MRSIPAFVVVSLLIAFEAIHGHPTPSGPLVTVTKTVSSSTKTNYSTSQTKVTTTARTTTSKKTTTSKTTKTTKTTTSKTSKTTTKKTTKTTKSSSSTATTEQSSPITTPSLTTTTSPTFTETTPTTTTSLIPTSTCRVIGRWGQCGGTGFPAGCVVCEDPHICKQFDPWNAFCNPAGNAEGCLVPRGQQCGGKGWTDCTTCFGATCVVIDDNVSLCQ